MISQKLFLTIIISLTVTLGVTKFLLGEMRHAMTVSIEHMTAQEQEAMIRVTELESAYAKHIATLTTDTRYLVGYVEDAHPVFVRSGVETAFATR